VPIEVCREYQLPAYADGKTLVFVASYSGDTEEALSAFLDALKRNCMVFCFSSGGALLEYAEKLKVPYLRVPSGLAPRVGLPYMFVPLLLCMEKAGLVSNVSEELVEAFGVLEKIIEENSWEKPIKGNFAKALALNLDQTVPIVYGFGVYRGVAERFKQQFNENSKIPAKWEVFSELNHNDIVGWENAKERGGYFTTIFIRDKNEPVEIKSRIDVTIEIMSKTGLKMFEVEAQGRSELAKMLSVICIGDLVSIYLAVLHKVDPTPVKIISYLKGTLEKNGVKKKILGKLAKLA